MTFTIESNSAFISASLFFVYSQSTVTTALMSEIILSMSSADSRSLSSWSPGPSSSGILSDESADRSPFSLRTATAGLHVTPILIFPPSS